MDAIELLDRLRESLEAARSMPMSSSAVVNRGDLLAQVDAVRAALAGSDGAPAPTAPVVVEARAEAERILVEAAQERDRLVAGSEVHRAGVEAAAAHRELVERECEELRKETDEYVDERLANFQITLTKTLEAVQRGRDHLRGRSDLDRLADQAPEAGFAFPERH